MIQSKSRVLSVIFKIYQRTKNAFFTISFLLSDTRFHGDLLHPLRLPHPPLRIITDPISLPHQREKEQETRCGILPSLHERRRRRRESPLVRSQSHPRGNSRSRLHRLHRRPRLFLRQLSSPRRGSIRRQSPLSSQGPFSLQRQLRLGIQFGSVSVRLFRLGTVRLFRIFNLVRLLLGSDSKIRNRLISIKKISGSNWIPVTLDHLG